MRKFFLFALACLVAAPSYGAVVTITGGNTQSSAGRAPTAAELGSDASLAGKKVYEFTVTTDQDIISIDNIKLTPGGGAQLYQVGIAEGGSDVEPPSPLFVGVFPKLGADSWISTPGATS